MKSTSLNRIVLTLIATSLVLPLFAQQEIPVDMYTGTPTIQIPLTTLTDHDIKENIGLSYTASGVRLEEGSGLVGVGWNLVASGSIRREVRGLPDDFGGTGADTRKGWLYGTTSTDVGAFSNSSDLSSATCTDEQIDYNTINGYNYTIDTEPDLFYFNFGSYSGKFVFDNAGNIRLIPFQDIKIEFTTLSVTVKQITSFKITTNEGYKYTFDLNSTASKSIQKATGITSVEYLKTEFEQYDIGRYPGKATYTAEWKLSKIESPTGAFINFTYTPESSTAVDTLRVAIRQNTSSAVVLKDIYLTTITLDSRVLTSIQGSAGMSVDFQFGSTNTGSRIIGSIVVNDTKRLPNPFIKSFGFSYKQIYLANNNSPATARTFLQGVSQLSGCDKIPPYKFLYYGVDFQANTSTLPRSYSKNKDFWGYYNGRLNSSSVPKIYVYPQLGLAERYRLTPIAGATGIVLDGADRTPEYLSMGVGTLDEVVFPEGGSAKMIFEPHDYFDPAANQTLMGGGLRVKRIHYFDGVTPAETIKVYDYTDASGNSSGRLISKPNFVIPTWEYRDPANAANEYSYATLAGGNAQAMWEYLTVRTADDMASQDDTHGSTVGYANVKVTRPGSGYAKFEFSLPAVFGSGAAGDWTPTNSKFTRNSAGVTCPAIGIVTDGGAWGSLSPPSPNFDFERGLLLRKYEYNEQNVLVRQTDNTFQRLIKSGVSPTSVWGLRYDKYANSDNNIYFFGKYFLLTDVQKVLASETVTTFDGGGVSTTTDYFYESASHKLLTKVKKTNSDGSITYSKLKYPLDYGTIPATGVDKASEMVRKLQLDFRNGIPIEQVQSIQRPSLPEKVISASVTKFSDFGGTKVLPEKQLALSVATGITDFVPSAITLQGATYAFTQDSRYELANTFIKYDSYHLPLLARNIKRELSGTLWGYTKTLPVAELRNASPDQIAFSDFETSTGYEFQMSEVLIGTGRTGLVATHPKVKLSRLLQRANVNNYILSFWLKKQSTPVVINVKIMDDELVVYYNQLLTFTPQGTDFEYFEKLIPVAGLPPVMKIEIQGQFTGRFFSSPSLLPMMDDVAFYPQNANLVSHTYDIPYGRSSSTDVSGNTSYTVFDQLGRPKYLLDKDKNIRKKNTYQYTSVAAPVLDGLFSFTTPVNDNTPITFTASENCIDGVQYEWDFGAGYIVGERVQLYTFTTTGAKIVKLRKTHPQYGERITTQNLTVALKQLDVVICAKGVSYFDQCNSAITGSYYCANIATGIIGRQTIFSVTSVTGATGAYTYQWKKYVPVSGELTNVGTTTEMTVNDLPTTSNFYCVVTDSNGRVGYSNTFTVTIYRSDPNCGFSIPN